MMRRVAERHRGLLPLDTVEGIWRVIIATFTYVQAPFSVHADISGGDAPMRDSARFHFGFTVPYRPHPTCLAVIEAVAASRGDLGIFRLDPDGSGPPTAAAPWWEGLVGAGRPKVIARLPFIERPDPPGRHAGLRGLEPAGRSGRGPARLGPARHPRRRLGAGGRCAPCRTSTARSSPARRDRAATACSSPSPAASAPGSCARP